MSSQTHASLDRTLAALADPTRRAILARLRQGETRVTDLAQPFRMSLNAVSKHVRVLEGAGLLRRDVRGRTHVLSFHGESLDEAARWIDDMRRFWNDRLAALEALLREQNTPRSKEDTNND